MDCARLHHPSPQIRLLWGWGIRRGSGFSQKLPEPEEGREAGRHDGNTLLLPGDDDDDDDGDNGDNNEK